MAELTLVTMVFDAARPDELAAVLAKYVVLARQHNGCRNIDLCASLTKPGRFVVVEKWASVEALKSHLAAPHMTDYRSRVKDYVVSAKLQVLQPA